MKLYKLLCSGLCFVCLSLNSGFIVSWWAAFIHCFLKKNFHLHFTCLSPRIMCCFMQKLQWVNLIDYRF